MSRNTTLLDEYIMTCNMNKDIMPVFKYMDKAIKETTPVAHMWREENPMQVALPSHPLDWPDPAMCIYSPTGVTKGYHRFCVDIGYNGEFIPWFDKTVWVLNGVLVFQQSSTGFDVVPLAKSMSGTRNLVMGEVQLHFELEQDAWVWSKATTGPINPLFHDYFIGLIAPEDMEQVEEGIDYLGNVVHLYLGTYWQHMQKHGKWNIHFAQDAKLKYDKNGKIKKAYKPATVGYKEFVLE